jgi:ribosomal protein S19E (S16A)
LCRSYANFQVDVTPLRYACCNNHKETSDLLTRHGAKVLQSIAERVKDENVEPKTE